MQRLFLRHHIVFLIIAATILVPMESQAEYKDRDQTPL